MASERRVEVLTRHLTSAAISTSDAVPDFDAGGVYLFLTRDNVELRAKMLDFMKVFWRLHLFSALSYWAGTAR